MPKKLYLNRIFSMPHPFQHLPQVGLVSNFDELIHRAFKDEMNALCWYRNLLGDFKEIVEKLELFDDITEVTVEDLSALELTEQGNLARVTILNDLQQLTDCGASPSLNLIKCYARDDELEFIATDVYSFHVDRSPIGTDTFLCTYYGAASDIVPNTHVEQKILIPEIRQKLYELYDGPAQGFEQFLQEYFFDLHYQAKVDAQAVNLGTGHLWRLAVDHPQQQVQPCVHRAPVENTGEYRLLLIC